MTLQALASLDVIVVTAAGNDSDTRSGMKCMEMADGMRLGPRYPAAFADTIPQVIPVGAIDGTGKPASYSDYPGANGVATYGGGLLMSDWLIHSPATHMLWSLLIACDVSTLHHTTPLFLKTIQIRL